MLDESMLTVEIASFEDIQNGKHLFKGFANKMKNLYQGELCSVGVMENGTESGKPSIMFLFKVTFSNNGKPDHFYCCAEATGQNFIYASQVANVHISKFLRKINPNNEKMI